MGIFRKKEYTLKEVLKSVHKGEDYEFIPINPLDANTKYIKENPKKVQKRIDELKVKQNRGNIEQIEFRNRINGNGLYQNIQETITPIQIYNDYQSSRGYKNSSKQIYR